jgi:phosphoribosylaminoimidazolecarboxamide formyltransferase/IMP cyclohydrolase
VRRALLSVSDKTGIVDLARALAARGIELLSTGGTAEQLRAAGVAVREVADYTGFPEIMDGRVKTLHPRIHGGLLGRESADADAMRAHGILPIDLLVVNLYPFAATIARPGVSADEAIEEIDVGGPAMLRAAAKNHARVAVLVDPADYAELLAALATGGTSLALRRRLAQKVYAHTGRYDALVAGWFARESPAPEPFPDILALAFPRREALRYGENPHQSAACYLDPAATGAAVVTARQVQGKELSYNNVVDADTALECVRQFAAAACVIVKHANPCGVAVRATPLEAYREAYRTDPTSAFGGIIAFNCPLDARTAEEIVARQFVEVIVAPAADRGALAALAAKPNVRLLLTGTLQRPVAPAMEYRSVTNGLLVQSRDVALAAVDAFQVVTRRAPTSAELSDLWFAFAVAKYVKSNAIVLARGHASIGMGAGQMSRITAARVAAMKAGESGLTVAGAVLASDAFFPFRDGVDLAAELGITAIVQPGGSMHDEAVVAAADEHGLAMVCTGERHFRH